MLFSGALDDCRVCDIDYNFIKYFDKAKSLFWMTLVDAPISTLGFLVNVPNLQILNLTGCKNLVDADFLAVASCKNLDQLYLSFTKVSPETLINITTGKRLTALDVSGVKLKLQHCHDILRYSWETLLFFHLSLEEDIAQNQFELHIRDVYRGCSFNLFRPWRNLV